MKRLVILGIIISFITTIAKAQDSGKQKTPPAPKQYTLTLPLEAWSTVFQGINTADSLLLASDLPTRSTNASIRTLSLLSSEIQRQISEQMKPDTTKRKK